jgi:hypothetical protein
MWNSEFQKKARLEGWFLSFCDGSLDGKWQIQKDVEQNMFVDDTAVWRFVVNGSGEHHKAAVAFIKQYNPKEYSKLLQAGGSNPLVG